MIAVRSRLLVSLIIPLRYALASAGLSATMRFGAGEASASKPADLHVEVHELGLR